VTTDTDVSATNLARGALLLAVFVYGAAVVGSLFAAEFGSTVLEGSALDHAAIYGDRLIAALASMVALYAFASLALGLRSARRAASSRANAWVVGAAVAGFLGCAFAVFIRADRSSHALGALLSDDSAVERLYGNEGWLILGSFVLALACVEALRRIA
jgi:amino acid permease